MPVNPKKIAEIAAKKQAAGVMFKPAAAQEPLLFSTTPESQVQLTAAFVAAGAGLWTDGTPWTTADGTMVPLNADDVQGLATRVLNYFSAVAKYAHDVIEGTEPYKADGWPSNA